MNSTELIIILVVVGAGFGGLIWLINTKLSARQEDSEALKVTTEWMKQMQSSFENRLDKSASELNERLDRAAAVIGDLKKEMGGFTEVGRSMKDFLAAPKTRGNFGELILEELLRQHLPTGVYHMQYKFKNGETVDAAIQLDGKILCVDSKFPLENFKAIFASENPEDRLAAEKLFVRDVKKHIDDISKKYILPQENTYDFALMYVPSEAVYYEILRNDSIMEHARNKKVSLVSPQAMYYQLYIVNQIMKGQKINSTAQEVLKYFAAIKQEASKFGTHLDVLSRHVTNAKNTIDTVNSSFAKLNDKVERAAELQAVETEVIAEVMPKPPIINGPSDS